MSYEDWWHTYAQYAEDLGTAKTGATLDRATRKVHLTDQDTWITSVRQEAGPSTNILSPRKPCRSDHKVCPGRVLPSGITALFHSPAKIDGNESWSRYEAYKLYKELV